MPEYRRQIPEMIRLGALGVGITPGGEMLSAPALIVIRMAARLPAHLPGLAPTPPRMIRRGVSGVGDTPGGVLGAPARTNPRYRSPGSLQQAKLAASSSQDRPPLGAYGFRFGVESVVPEPYGQPAQRGQRRIPALVPAGLVT